jgi:cobalt-zinc-cadmium efflux system outer membrane protein
MAPHRWSGCVLLLALGGCSLPFSGGLDREIDALSARIDAAEGGRPVDPLPAATPPARPPVAPLLPAAFREEQKDERPRRELLVPPDLPGAKAQPIRLPEDKEERGRYVRQLYPPLGPLPPVTPPAPGPQGRPLSLADLQALGETYSPAVKSARAAVDAALGAAKQAGAYPNPTFAFEYDTVQTVGGYPGFFVDQVIKTGNKLKLAQAAALMDVLSARLALRRARSDLHTSVRGFYFAVLVARENIKVSQALYQFTENLYRVQVNLLEGGFAAGYEPMQLRPLALQARLNLITARNQYLASWKQLAASLGLPDMPPAEVEGRVDMAVPTFDADAVLAYLRDNHTDVLTALSNLQKARYNLQLARVTPLPDVEVRWLVQKDYSTPPNQIANSFQMSLPVPIWDQNRGAIRQAEALLAQASVGPDQARNTLAVGLADAYNRYQTAQQSVAIAAQQVSDQLRVYRGMHARWDRAPLEVAFPDLVAAEQTLVGYVGAYVTALGQQWQAVVDVANYLQTDDLFAGALTRPVPAVPELDHFPLPLLLPPGADKGKAILPVGHAAVAPTAKD